MRDSASFCIHADMCKGLLCFPYERSLCDLEALPLGTELLTARPASAFTGVGFNPSAKRPATERIAPDPSRSLWCWLLPRNSARRDVVGFRVSGFGGSFSIRLAIRCIEPFRNSSELLSSAMENAIRSSLALIIDSKWADSFPSCWAKDVS